MNQDNGDKEIIKGMIKENCFHIKESLYCLAQWIKKKILSKARNYEILEHCDKKQILSSWMKQNTVPETRRKSCDVSKLLKEGNL